MSVSPKNRRLALALGLAALIGTGSAMAGTRMENDNCPAGEFAQRMEKRHTEQLARLYAVLKITPAQEAAWSNFAASTQPPKLDPALRTAPASDVPSRLEQRLALHKAFGDHLQQEAKATRALYDQLSPEQKKAFDEFHLHQGPGHDRGPRHHEMDDHAAPPPAAR